MQGIHCTSDGPWVIKRLGEKRAEDGAYVWQKLMKSGATICNGTDAPVEDVDPIACFYATVTRKLKDGTVFYPDQRMSREEALRSYTLNCAYASFQEDMLGSLTPGKLADITQAQLDELESLINAAKQRGPAEPQSLFQWIRRRGGMWDKGGELRDMDLPAGIIRTKAGSYLPTQALYNALDTTREVVFLRDLSGTYRHRGVRIVRHIEMFPLPGLYHISQRAPSFAVHRVYRGCL